MENQKTPEEIELNVKLGLLSRGFTDITLLNNRGLIGATIEETVSHVSTSHQEANEINVCFSKPYQKLQRELFEKKKESELFKEANAKLVEALKISIRHTSELRSIYGSDAGVETIEDIEDNLSTLRELLQTYETK